MLGMTTTAIRITGVDFAYVPVTDFDAAKHFYGDVLGLKQSKQYGKMPGGEFETGTLIASGISVEESDTVASAYMRAGMTERHRRSVNEWIVLELASAGDPRTHDFSYGGEGTWRHSLPLRASGSAAAPVGLSGGFE